MEKKLKNAIWFSRHQPTPEQLAEIAGKGEVLVDLDAGMTLGARSINSEGELADVVCKLRTLARKHSAWTIYGVFPTPVLGVMSANYVGVSYDDTLGHGLTCFSAWNIMRSAEGGKPSFEHKKFVCVGMLFAGNAEEK